MNALNKDDGQKEVPALSRRTPAAAASWARTGTAWRTFHPATPVRRGGRIAFRGIYLGMGRNEFLEIPAPAFAAGHQIDFACGDQDLGRLPAIKTFKLVDGHRLFPLLPVTLNI